jgi:hypothetical protein
MPLILKLAIMWAFHQASPTMPDLRQKRNPQYDYLLGADNTAVYMEGRLTGPLALSGVTPGSSAAATINGREGRFELLPNEQIAEHYWQFIGAPIRGIFRLVGKGSVQNV